MECPRCGSDRVEQLPPSQISPRPGYRCANCTAKMRAPGMLPVYLVALVIGLGLAGLFLFMLVSGEGDGIGLQGLWLVGLGLVCAGYSAVQLRRPVPRRKPEDR